MKETNCQLVEELNNHGRSLGNYASEGARRLNSQQNIELVWQVVHDFIAEGSAVCGPLFQPQEIADRRYQLEDIIGPRLTADITNEAHLVGQLVKMAAKRIGNSLGQDLPRDVAWAIIRRDFDAEEKKTILVAFLNEKYPDDS